MTEHYFQNSEESITNALPLLKVAASYFKKLVILDPERVSGVQHIHRESEDVGI